MDRLIPLRPELASVCRYVLLKQPAPGLPRVAGQATAGILADLTAIRGLQ